MERLTMREGREAMPVRDTGSEDLWEAIDRMRHQGEATEHAGQ